jgi:hypothetical protein
MKWKALILVSLFMLAASAIAQKTFPKYDLATETTMKGVVEEVKDVPGGCLGHTCVHVMLKTESGITEVQVAPEGFLHDMQFELAKGDHLQITGSKVTVDGASLVLARSITRGNDELVVRNDEGGPLRNWFRQAD